ncbi:MAG: ferredoxin [Quinella sp. 2Q5]|nr:ferredoxin [Quinella sp. 2Q5]
MRCLACAGESEFGGVIFDGNRIVIDRTRPEDWQTIAAICPTGAIKILSDDEESD